jgi:hypothetical protein
LARAFYHSLWRTLTPGRALFDARRVLAESDDGTWLSPILLSQSA